jgi:hypothetical protein
MVSIGRERGRRATAWLALGEPIHWIPALDGVSTDPELARHGSDPPALLLQDLQPRIALHAQGTPLMLFPLLAAEAAKTSATCTLMLSVLVLGGGF